ncbi:hypothetical protein GH714_033568 [Hevea brasiliensis]|uniref:Metal-nicotianamine transporter YSL7 n=1 Tax=Hevea brasiliensis TaxID=3981 RepID=A0A6A6MQT6_HEVBR|nr:hypothetical protein GH714_033568 [Hevea brasiliensis]
MAMDTNEERNPSSYVSEERDEDYLHDAQERKKKKKKKKKRLILEEESELESVEKIFEAKEIPPWQNQLTLRAFVVSFILGVLFSFIVMKLNLTTGVIPSLNVSAGLLGFSVKTWTKLLHKAGLLKQPFTRQENTVIQTCVVATSGIAFSGGFGSYLFGMSETVAKQSTEANDAQNIKNPSLGWMIGFFLLLAFLASFLWCLFGRIMIIEFKLIYPSGAATAHLINSFHTPQGAKLAKKQVRELGKFFSFSFLWGFFQWFFTAGDDCGFVNFPTFGLKAYQNKFYFDFSATYVGVGMICPYLINASLLVGAILSWGIMWPLINTKKGDWYSEEHSASLQGLQGYKVFIAIAMILGDGAYNFCKVIGRTLFAPHIFHQLKWYYVAVIYIIAPVLAFCNAYGCGLTDWSLVSTYGKLAIFTIGAWAGAANGGVLAGLAAWRVMMNIVSTASDLMQDFKTGYMTLASPRSMFGSGFSALPKHCLTLCYIFFVAAVVINGMRDAVGKKRARFIPLPMAMAIPFYIGGYFAIDMCVGSLMLYIWRKINKAKADAFGPAVASGVICGDGIWTLRSSILSLAGAKPPLCMKFLSKNQNAKVDGFLNS